MTTIDAAPKWQDQKTAAAAAEAAVQLQTVAATAIVVDVHVAAVVGQL